MCTANKHAHCRVFPAVGTCDQRSLSTPGLASSHFPTERNPKRSSDHLVASPASIHSLPFLTMVPAFHWTPHGFRERDSSPSSREQQTTGLSQSTVITGLQALSQVLCRECWDKPLSPCLSHWKVSCTRLLSSPINQ